MHILDDLVTLASGRLQSVTVKNDDFAAVVTDQFAQPQISRGLGHAYPPHTQHIAQQILREMELIRSDPVTRHQQPAGETCLDLVKAIARGGLCHLYHQFVDVAVHRLLQAGAVLVFLAKVRG